MEDITNQPQEKTESITEADIGVTATDEEVAEEPSTSITITRDKNKLLYDIPTNQYFDSIDRKTLFEDGMLVLTSTNLILYSSDEKDELKRILLSIIDECSCDWLRRGLVIKKRVNTRENFNEYIKQLREKKMELEQRIEGLKEEMKESDKEDRERLKEELSGIEEEIDEIMAEIAEMDNDPTKIETKERELAKIQKEVFRLPKNYHYTHSAKEEYKIWEYAIRRRLKGPSKIKVETRPHDAIVRINNEIVGTTPLNIELPLLDGAILNAEYHVELLKEKYEKVNFSIPIDHNSTFKESKELKPMKSPDEVYNQGVKSLRVNLPDRSVDLSYYSIDREIMGTDELLLLTKDALLVLSKDRTQYLLEIPYGSIKEVKYDTGFFGSKSVKITYNDKDFKDDSDFVVWVDNKDGQMSDKEVKRYSESLVEHLSRMMKESSVTTAPMRKRAKEHYLITEKDLQNNFRRFEAYEFEVLIAKLFNAKGYQVEVTPKSGDVGVDVLAKAGHDVVAIQVKHWRAPVGGPDVLKTLGGMVTSEANHAIVITTSHFTNQAYEIQKRGAAVDLWDGERVKEEFRKNFLSNN